LVQGKVSCALLGNVGTVGGGLEVFPDASPTDGMVELAVVTASSTSQWLRVFSRLALGRVDRRPLLDHQGQEDRHQAGSQDPFELDGSPRAANKRSRFASSRVPIKRVRPGVRGGQAFAAKEDAPRRQPFPRTPRAVEKEEAPALSTEPASAMVRS